MSRPGLALFLFKVKVVDVHDKHSITCIDDKGKLLDSKWLNEG